LFARRIAKGNWKRAYIFGGPAPKQKPHNTKRSRGKADGSEGGTAEAVFGKIRSQLTIAARWKIQRRRLIGVT
jgi:hypothetical protein